MKYKTALVTGGAGFIGSHIVESLIGKGIKTYVIDDLSMGKPENVMKDAELIVGDITDMEKVMTVMEGIDVVFHQAAKVSIRNSFRNFVEDARTNIMGTVNLIHAAGMKKVKKFIYASSMAVYGDQDKLPISERACVSPDTPYGISKATAERYVIQMGPKLGFSTAALRYFNTYGTRQTLTPYVGVITIFINRMLDGCRPVIFGDGEQVRDFVHVRDVADANTAALEADIDGEILNIGSGVGTSVNEVFEILKNEMKMDMQPQYGPKNQDEPEDSVADISLAKQRIGYEPKRSLQTHIRDVVEWLERKRRIEAS